MNLTKVRIITNIHQNAFFPFLQEIRMRSSASSIKYRVEKKARSFKKLVFLVK